MSFVENENYVLSQDNNLLKTNCLAKLQEVLPYRSDDKKLSSIIPAFSNNFQTKMVHKI